MENSEKIYDQFRNAAQKAEQKPYPDMDKVWSRVEDKLDRKMLTRQNHLWKKIAIAASFILAVTLLYQVLAPKNTIVEKPNEEIVVAPVQNPSDESKTPMQSDEVKLEAAQILEHKISNDVSVATLDAHNYEVLPAISVDTSARESMKYSQKEKRNGKFHGSPQFDAIGLTRAAETAEVAQSEEQTPKKAAPLLIVDGKAVSENQKVYGRTVDKALSGEPSEDQEFLVLKEPLYIINGTSYTEADLFGPNPTSPYAPLNKQEIESVTILQSERATAIYGERGKKGVVIIFTKNRKPLDAERK
ncbi:MAG TPA: hypothetical protein VF676_08395 [Flavobacterium sp.]|jgi:hypothetical protein